jgi:hypothetical protein
VGFSDPKLNPGGIVKFGTPAGMVNEGMVKGTPGTFGIEPPGIVPPGMDGSVLDESEVQVPPLVRQVIALELYAGLLHVACALDVFKTNTVVEAVARTKSFFAK